MNCTYPPVACWSCLELVWPDGSSGECACTNHCEHCQDYCTNACQKVTS